MCWCDCGVAAAEEAHKRVAWIMDVYDVPRQVNSRENCKGLGDYNQD